MRGIYLGLRTGATFILLAGALPAMAAPVASAPATYLWTQPSGMAVGDRFLALGYGRGIEYWDWSPDLVPVLNSRHSGPEVTALWGRDSTLHWSTVDSTLRTATLQGSVWTPGAPVRLDGVASALSGSREFVAAVIGTSHLRFARRPVPGLAFAEWQPPGHFPIAYLSVRDSTAAVAGADRAFLVRLRDSGAVLLDSLSLGAFVQAVQWAGDSLYMAFGYSGMRLARTQSDRFVGGLAEWTSSGSFGRLVLTDAACTALDFFGQMEVFARGEPLVPKTRLSFGGTPRAAAGRSHEIALLTVERGLALLNLFTLESPFWSYHTTFPGFVRDLESSANGVFALADFAGVYELGVGEHLVVSHPYNEVSLDVEWPHLAATSLLGGVAVAVLTSSAEQPYVVVPTLGMGRRSVITGDRLFVAADDLCDTGLVVYQLLPPGAPFELARLAVCGALSAMAAGPGVVAIALRDSGLQLFDAYAPEAGAIWATPPGEVWDELVWQGNDLWGRNRSSQLARWYWDGAQLAEQDRHDVPGMRAFDVWRSTQGVTSIVTSDSSRKVTVWRWQSRSPLVPLDSLATRNIVTSVAICEDTIWAADRDAVVRYEVRSPASVKEPVVRPERPLLEVPYPNPFNGALVITLHPDRGRWSVTIVDLLGRKLGHWGGVARSSGPARLVWDPAAAGGVPSGLYLVRAENAGRSQSRKVVYLK